MRSRVRAVALWFGNGWWKGSEWVDRLVTNDIALVAMHTRTGAQPSILRLKAVFKRPQLAAAQQQRGRVGAAAPQREKATPKPKPTKPEAAKAAAMETAAPVEEQEEEEEEVDEMEVEVKKVKGRKPRTTSRFKKTGSLFAAKKQKGPGAKK